MSVLLNEPFAFMKLGPLLILLALREETGKHESELLQLLCWQAGRQTGKSKTEASVEGVKKDAEIPSQHVWGLFIDIYMR